MDRTVVEEARSAGAASAAISVERFRSALERALSAAAEDEQIASALAATGLRMRFTFTDWGLSLDVAAGGADAPGLRWSFEGEVDWEPRLELSMSVAVANRYLQGNESPAIAIAHRQMRCSGESSCALRYLPATRLISGPYRRVIHEDFPDLVIGSSPESGSGAERRARAVDSRPRSA